MCGLRRGGTPTPLGNRNTRPREIQCYDEETVETLQAAVKANVQDGTLNLNELPV